MVDDSCRAASVAARGGTARVRRVLEAENRAAGGHESQAELVVALVERVDRKVDVVVDGRRGRLRAHVDEKAVDVQREVFVARVRERDLERAREVNVLDERVARDEPFLRVDWVEEREVQTVLVHVGEEFARVLLAVHE